MIMLIMLMMWKCFSAMHMCSTFTLAENTHHLFFVYDCMNSISVHSLQSASNDSAVVAGAYQLQLWSDWNETCVTMLFEGQPVGL